jgi:hypothetical protein
VEELLSDVVLFVVRTLRVALFWVVSRFVSVPVFASVVALFSEAEAVVALVSLALLLVLVEPVVLEETLLVVLVVLVVLALVVSVPLVFVVVVLFDVVLSVRLSVFWIVFVIVPESIVVSHVLVCDPELLLVSSA